MGSSANLKIAGYASVAALSAVFLCPVVGIGVGLLAAAEVTDKVFKHPLSKELYEKVTGRGLDPLRNHHHQQLIGRTLAALIDAYDGEHNQPGWLAKKLPILRRKDPERSALAKAAVKHWADTTLELGEGDPLKDERLYEVFIARERTSEDPYVVADVWDDHLKVLATDAKTWYGESVAYMSAERRRPLAEFIALHFAAGVRELVKADLDPKHGTGGRVFIGLHLDMMNALFFSVRQLGASSVATLEEIKTVQGQIETLSEKLIVERTDDQKQNADLKSLVEKNQREREETRAVLDELVRNSRAQLQKSDSLIAGQKKQDAQIEKQSTQLDRIEKLLLEQKQQNPNVAPVLSPKDQRILDEARQSDDLRTRLSASVLEPDEETDAMLAHVRRKHEANEYELSMLEGKRWFFARPVSEPDKAIVFFERAVQLRPTNTEARNYAARAHNEARLGDIAAHQHRAIELLEGTLRLVPGESTNWATTQNNLGIAWQNLPTGNKGENLKQAIAAYEAALTVRTKTAHPVEWAMTQNNLGIAWRNLPTGDKGENLKQAIAAYEAALTVFTKTAHPVGWAKTQNNLGIAWQNLPTGDKGENLKQAIAAYEAALTVYTKNAHPVAWAMAQNNLGNAWREMPTDDKGENLKQAIAAYEAALTVYTKNAHPVAWAMAQNNVGLAWLFMPTGDKGENLNQAIAAYEAASTVYTKTAHPVDWAMTQNNVGLAWLFMPTGNKGENLKQAIAAYEAALTVRTKTAHPVEWAMTQYNVAIALAEKAELPGEDRCGLLRRAIAASKGALTIRTAKAFPRDHADTTHNLAIFRKAYEAAGCAEALPFDEIPPAA